MAQIILCFLPLTRIHMFLYPPLYHSYIPPSSPQQTVSYGLQTSRKTHTNTNLLRFRAHMEHERKSTVILHNKSPIQVLLLYSLWANQLFWASISLSIHRKHVSIHFGSFSSLRKPSCSFSPFLFLFCPTSCPSALLWDSKHGQHGKRASLAGFFFFFSIEFQEKEKKKDCHHYAGMSIYKLHVNNSSICFRASEKSQNFHCCFCFSPFFLI